eukprot:jgi/Chlat1/7873/Chrsp66S07305
MMSTDGRQLDPSFAKRKRTAFRLVEVNGEPALPPQISICSAALVAGGASLFIGTTDGQLLQLLLQERQEASTTSVQARSIGRRHIGRRPVDSLSIVSGPGVVAALCDGALLLFSSDRLEGDGLPIPDVKSATVVLSIPGQDFPGGLVVAGRKRLLQLEVRGPGGAGAGKPARICELQDEVLSMAWCGDALAIATQHGYSLLNLRTRASIKLFDLPSTGSLPLVKSLPSLQAALLLSENVGLFVEPTGQPQATTVVFVMHPSSIAHSAPYLVALHNGYLDVYDYANKGRTPADALVQTFELSHTETHGLLIDDVDGQRVLAITSSTLWCLLPVLAEEQVRELLKKKRCEEAVAIAEALFASQQSTLIGGDLLEDLTRAEAGFIRWHDLDFSQAIEHFLQCPLVEPGELFAFFPEFTSRWRTRVPTKRYLGMHPAPRRLAEVVQSGLRSLRTGVAPWPADLPPETDWRSTTDSQEHIDYHITRAKRSTIKYLNAVRTLPSVPSQQLAGVDTLLLILLAETGSSSELEKFASSANSCMLKESEEVLRSKGQVAALARLLEQKGDLRGALGIWQELSTTHEALAPSSNVSNVMKQNTSSGLGVQEFKRLLSAVADTAFVLEQIRWLIPTDLDTVMDIVTSTRRSSALSSNDVLAFFKSHSKELAAFYLEYIVTEQGIADTQLHTELAMALLSATLAALPKDRPQHASKTRDQHPTDDVLMPPIRQRLLHFLRTSAHYSVEDVLAKVKRTQLYHEQVVLYGRTRQHQEALRVLALSLGDFEGAERYCEEHQDEDTHMLLLHIYLMPGQGREALHSQAMRLLQLHGRTLDPVQVLDSLPADIPLGLIVETLARMLRERVHRQYQGQIVRQLARATSLTAMAEHAQERLRSTVITDERSCLNCHTRISTKPFAIYPNDHLVCYKCLRKFGEHVDPVSGRDFRTGQG